MCCGGECAGDGEDGCLNGVNWSSLTAVANGLWRQLLLRCLSTRVGVAALPCVVQ